jgi:hypothetical protein
MTFRTTLEFTLSPPYMYKVCQTNLWFGANDFVFYFCSLSSSILMSNPLIFQNIFLICFFFKFDHCCFDYYFFNFIILQFFYLSYFVRIVLIVFFSSLFWFILFFNLIPRNFIWFNFYTRFDYHYFDCYLFVFLILDD